MLNKLEDESGMIFKYFNEITKISSSLLGTLKYIFSNFIYPLILKFKIYPNGKRKKKIEFY